MMGSFPGFVWKGPQHSLGGGCAQRGHPLDELVAVPLDGRPAHLVLLDSAGELHHSVSAMYRYHESNLVWSDVTSTGTLREGIVAPLAGHWADNSDGTALTLTNAGDSHGATGY